MSPYVTPTIYSLYIAAQWRIKFLCVCVCVCVLVGVWPLGYWDKADVTCSSAPSVMFSSFNMLFSLSIHLSIIFCINRLVVWSTKCQKMVKNVEHCFPKPKVTSSNVLFCLCCHRGLKKPENIHIWEAEIREFGHVVLKKWLKTINWLSKQLASNLIVDNWSINRLMFVALKLLF